MVAKQLAPAGGGSPGTKGPSENNLLFVNTEHPTQTVGDFT